MEGDKKDAEKPSSSGRPQKRFELVKWDASAMWSWDIMMDSCPICRNSIMDLCIDCQAKLTENASVVDECTAAWGACNHGFHHHCIQRWLCNRNVCPLDNKEWQYARFGK